MEIVSAREFRANQSAILTKARRGESVVLTSRVGNFKIVPLTERDSLASHISESLREVELIEKGIKPAKTARAFLDEL